VNQERFDELAKGLAARSLSRRQVLKGIVATIAAGAALTSIPRLAWAKECFNSLSCPPRHTCVGASPGRPGRYEKGDVVRDATWGEGEVVRVGGDSIYTFFPVHGEKLLKAHFLEKIGA
jgi:hypothetical protein